MKHLLAVASWAGVSIDDGQRTQLERYAAWLREEGLAAGGIGPHEANRVWERHIADSIAFSDAATLGGPVVDLGTGVGLPAVPLAIVHPGCAFLAVDRSGRRIDLLSRVIRILGIANLEPRHADIDDLRETFIGLTSRGVAGPSRTMAWARHLLEPGGIGVMGLSRREELPHLPQESALLDVSVIEVPAGLLDDTVTLLRMVRRVDH